MREIRQSGSEGGVAGNGHPYPYGEAWDVGLSVLLEMKLAALLGTGIESGAQSGLETFVSV